MKKQNSNYAIYRTQPIVCMSDLNEECIENMNVLTG